MGKSTISMVIFNSYVKLPEGNNHSPYEQCPHLAENMENYVPFQKIKWLSELEGW